MQLPLEINLRNVRKTKSIESIIQEKVTKLEQVCNYITSCRIAVEKIQKQQKKGNPFRVRIDLNLPPNHEIVVHRESTENDPPYILGALIRDAFDIARRQLQKQIEKQRHEIKVHPTNEINGIIQKLFREQDYGFIQGLDGTEIYFHRHSVLHGDFNRLEIGTGVRYLKKDGEDGPQASSVQIIDRAISNLSP